MRLEDCGVQQLLSRSPFASVSAEGNRGRAYRVASKRTCGRGADRLNAFADHGAILRGGWGGDVLRGGYGPDTLLGGAGQDTAYGKQGRDLCVAEVRNSCKLP